MKKHFYYIIIYGFIIGVFNILIIKIILNITGWNIILVK